MCGPAIWSAIRIQISRCTPRRCAIGTAARTVWTCGRWRLIARRSTRSATATDSARRLQEEQTDALAGAWQGRGAEASRAFLARHAEASASAASAVRDAADALAALRDDLWHAVDAKVGVAVEIEGRRHTERAEWLAATRTVTTGAGDRAVASELVDQNVKPFVDNDIRAEWLAAMQKTMAAASAAFDDATSVLTGEPAMPFEVPGDLGPSVDTVVARRNSGG